MSNSSFRLPPTVATSAISTATIPIQLPITLHGWAAFARIQRASAPVERRSWAARRSLGSVIHSLPGVQEQLGGGGESFGKRRQRSRFGDLQVDVMALPRVADDDLHPAGRLIGEHRNLHAARGPSGQFLPLGS